MGIIFTGLSVRPAKSWHICPAEAELASSSLWHSKQQLLASAPRCISLKATQQLSKLTCGAGAGVPVAAT